MVRPESSSLLTVVFPSIKHPSQVLQLTFSQLLSIRLVCHIVHAQIMHAILVKIVQLGVVVAMITVITCWLCVWSSLWSCQLWKHWRVSEWSPLRLLYLLHFSWSLLLP